MNLRILQEAEEELADAITRYESIQSGLGIRLKEEVRATLLWIGLNPDLPRRRPKGYRRVNRKVFPYYVTYVEYADALWVLAVAKSPVDTHANSKLKL